MGGPAQSAGTASPFGAAGGIFNSPGDPSLFQRGIGSMYQSANTASSILDQQELTQVNIPALSKLSTYLEDSLRNGRLDFSPQQNKELAPLLADARKQLEILVLGKGSDGFVKEALADVVKLQLQINAIDRLPSFPGLGLFGKQEPAATPQAQILRDAEERQAAHIRTETLTAAGKTVGELIPHLAVAIPYAVDKVGDAQRAGFTSALSSPLKNPGTESAPGGLSGVIGQTFGQPPKTGGNLPFGSQAAPGSTKK